VNDIEQESLEGFLFINKPNGATSAHCIKRIKQLVEKKTKIGHAGTLDSFATGLLIIAINRIATRHVEKLMSLDKRYIAQGKLGQLTDTLDFTGELLVDEDVANVTKEKLEQAIAAFGKGYLQTPPIFSALKHEGRRLSELARSGTKTMEELAAIAAEKARPVQLYELKLVSFKPPFFTVFAHVSHGTYVRSLLDDIAQKVGTRATTHALERSQIGPFTLQDAVDMHALDTLEDIIKNLVSTEAVLKQLEKK